MALRRSPRLARSAGPRRAIAKASSSSRGASRPKPKSKPKAKPSQRSSATGPSGSSSLGPSRWHEEQRWEAGFEVVAGVDEAGRGPLVGPVVAAACVLSRNLDLDLDGINDSKKMTEEQRDRCFEVLTNSPGAVSYAWHAVSASEIDEINILQATMKAMETAVGKLPKNPDFVLVDGNRVPKGLDPRKAEAIVKGDGKSLAIACASVIAKVVRDGMMRELHKEFPHYGFDKHKGYGVPQHLRAIAEHGPCPHHRRTFAPIKHM